MVAGGGGGKNLQTRFCSVIPWNDVVLDTYKKNGVAIKQSLADACG